MMRVCRRDDHGSATMLGVGLMLLLTLALAAGLLVVQVVATHRAAQNAADLAALAGAGQVQEGGAPCAAANSVAARNGAALTDCAQHDQEVWVTVQVSPGTFLGFDPAISARARAGPVQ